MLIVASSTEGAPYETYNYSHESSVGGTSTGDFGNSQQGGTGRTTQDFGGVTETNSFTHSGISTVQADDFSGTTSYSESYSASNKTISGETDGEFTQETSGGQTFYTATQNSLSGGVTEEIEPLGGSNSGTFEIAQASFVDTTITTVEHLHPATITDSNTEDFFGLWFLTSQPSNSLGTELVFTSSFKRPIITYTEFTYTDLIVTTTKTCPRSHKTKWVIINDWVDQYAVFPDVNKKDFLFANSSQPSFNSNGLYLASVVLPTEGGFTTRTEYTFSTAHVNVAGGTAASVISSNSIPEADQTYFTFSGPPISEAQNRSQHSTIAYPDPLFGNVVLTTVTDSESVKYSFATLEASTYLTGAQLLIAQYGSPDTFRTSNAQGGRTIQQTNFYTLNTFHTRALVTGFFDSVNERVVQNFVATATFEQGGINGNYSTSTTNSSASGSTSHLWGTSRAQATLFAPNGTLGGETNGLNLGFRYRSGQGAGNAVIFTESGFLDFYLQDPFSKGLGQPLALELTGGFSDVGMLNAGYTNPANFFNYKDNLMGVIAEGNGEIGNGNNLGQIMACHRINASANYQFIEFGNTNASCPPTQNKTFSWLSEYENEFGTTQFLTYSFGTSPTYTITTANKRSDPTATITSGTSTFRWATEGVPQSGCRNLAGYEFYQQSVHLSTFGLTFDPAFNQALVATDIGSTSTSQTSITRVIRGFIGDDYTPQSVIPYGVTRELGIQQQILITPYRDDQQNGLNWAINQLENNMAIYRRPHPTSYVGFLGLLTDVPKRLAGASVGNLYIGYPFADVTAEFSDPSF